LVVGLVVVVGVGGDFGEEYFVDVGEGVRGDDGCVFVEVDVDVEGFGCYWVFIVAVQL